MSSRKKSQAISRSTFSLYCASMRSSICWCSYGIISMQQSQLLITRTMKCSVCSVKATFSASEPTLPIFFFNSFMQNLNTFLNVLIVNLKSYHVQVQQRLRRAEAQAPFQRALYVFEQVQRRAQLVVNSLASIPLHRFFQLLHYLPFFALCILLHVRLKALGDTTSEFVVMEGYFSLFIHLLKVFDFFSLILLLFLRSVLVF